MKQDISLDSLRDLMADVLDIDAGTIGDEARFIEDLGMDSLMALEIMVALEKKYGVKLKQDDLPKIKNLRDVQALVVEKVRAAA